MAGKQFKLSIIVDATTTSANKALGGLGKTLGGLAAAAGVAGTAILGGAALGGAALIKLAVDAATLSRGLRRQAGNRRKRCWRPCRKARLV
jgi:hypothetical protein